MNNSENQENIANLCSNKTKNRLERPFKLQQSQKSVSSFLNEFEVVESRMTDLNFEISEPRSPKILQQQKQCYNCPSCLIWEKWALQSQHCILSIQNKLIEREKCLQQKMRQIYTTLSQQTYLLKVKEQECTRLKQQNKQLKQMHIKQIRQNLQNDEPKYTNTNYQIIKNTKQNMNYNQILNKMQSTLKSDQKEDKKLQSIVQDTNSKQGQRQSEFKKKLRYNMGESKVYKQQKLYETISNKLSGNSCQTIQTNRQYMTNNQQFHRNLEKNLGGISKKEQKYLRNAKDQNRIIQINNINQHTKIQRQGNFLQQFQTQKSQTSQSHIQNSKRRKKQIVQILARQEIMNQQEKRPASNIEYKQQNTKADHHQSEQKQLKLGSIRTNFKNTTKQHRNEDNLCSNSIQKPKRQLQNEKHNKSLQSKRKGYRHNAYNYDANYYIGKSQQRKNKLGLHKSQDFQKTAIFPTVTSSSGLKFQAEQEQKQLVTNSYSPPLSKKNKFFETSRNKIQEYQSKIDYPVMRGDIRYSLNDALHQLPSVYNYSSAYGNQHKKFSSKLVVQQDLLPIQQEIDLYDFTKNYNSCVENNIKGIGDCLSNQFGTYKRMLTRNMPTENMQIKQSLKNQGRIRHNSQNLRTPQDTNSDLRQKIAQKQKRSYKYTQQFNKQKELIKNKRFQQDKIKLSKNSQIVQNIDNSAQVDSRQKSRIKLQTIGVFPFRAIGCESNLQEVQQFTEQDQYSKQYVRNFIRARLQKYNQQNHQIQESILNNIQSLPNEYKQKQLTQIDFSYNALATDKQNLYEQANGRQVRGINNNNVFIIDSQVRINKLNTVCEQQQKRQKMNISQVNSNSKLDKIQQQLQNWCDKSSNQLANQQIKYNSFVALQRENVQKNNKQIAQINNYQIQSQLKGSSNIKNTFQLGQSIQKSQKQQSIVSHDAQQKCKNRVVIKTKIEDQQNDLNQNNLILSKMSSNSSIKIIQIAQNQIKETQQKQSKQINQACKQLSSKYTHITNDKTNLQPLSGNILNEFSSMKILNKQHINSECDDERDFKVKTQKHFQKISFSDLDLGNNNNVDSVNNSNLSFRTINPKIKYVGEQQNSKNSKKELFVKNQNSRKYTEENDNELTYINIKAISKNQKGYQDDFKLNTQNINKLNQSQSQGQSTLKTIKLRNNPLNVQKSRVCEVNSDYSSLQNDTRHRIRNTNDQRASMLSEQLTREPSAARNPQLSQQYLSKISKEQQMISQLQKLKFQNQNLKSYNVVLLSKLGKHRPRKY